MSLRPAIGSFAVLFSVAVLLAAAAPACNEQARKKDWWEEPAAGTPNGSASSSMLAPRPDASAVPLAPLVMEFARPLKRAAVLDGEPARTWGPLCQVHRACEPIAPLRRCETGIAPVDASALGTLEPRALGERVSVRGRLGLAMTFSSFGQCRGFHCCNPCWNWVFVGDFPNAVRLEGLGCSGDESRRCCQVPAFGQLVVVTGRLMKETDSSLVARGSSFSLVDAVLCTEARPAGSAAAPTRL